MGSVGGLGAFVLRDGEDADRASMTLSGGKTSLDLRNDNHVNIASLHQAPTGGGFLQLGGRLVANRHKVYRRSHTGGSAAS
jgi:hypothetical protein